MCNWVSYFDLVYFVVCHDDILIAVDSDPDAQLVIAKLRDLSQEHYKITLDAVSADGVDMLDMHIFKGASVGQTQRLSYMPFIKPTARHIPSSSESNHHEGVLQSWPVAEIRRMHDLSQSPDVFPRFRDLKISRFEQFGMPANIVSRCKSWVH